MIEQEGKYYLYRHIRLDKNEPFYVGVGTKSGKKSKRFDTHYKRAFNTQRNNIWKGIVERTDYEVEILLESNDKKFIEEKEIEFIALYGRIVLETGTLANLHRGGNYKEGHKLSDEQRANISNRQRGENSPVAKKVIDIDTKIIYPTIEEIVKKYKYDSGSICKMLSGRALNKFNIMYYEDFLNDDYRAFSFIDKTKTPVIDTETGIRYPSIKECADAIGMSPSKLIEYVKAIKVYNITSIMKQEDYDKGLKKDDLNKCKIQKQIIVNVVTGEEYEGVKQLSSISNITEYILYHKLGGSCVNDTDYIYKKDFEKGLLPKDLRVDGKKKVIIDIITLKIYGSIKEASIDTHITEKTLASQLNPNNIKKSTTNMVYLSDYLLENPDFKVD